MNTIVFFSIDGSPNYMFRKAFINKLSQKYTVIVQSLFVRDIGPDPTYFDSNVKVEVGILSLLSLPKRLLSSGKYTFVLSQVKDLILVSPLLLLVGSGFIGIIEGLGKLFLSYSKTLDGRSQILNKLYALLFTSFIFILRIRSNRLVVLNSEDRTLIREFTSIDPVVLHGFGQHEYLFSSSHTNTTSLHNPEQYTCFFIGRGIHTKGIDDFMRLALRHNQQKTRVTFVTVGIIQKSGFEKVNRDIFKKYSNDPNCFTIDWVSELWQLVNSWPNPILVVPSLREGLSSVVLESMCFGIPVLGRDVPGVSDFNTLLESNVVEIVDDFECYGDAGLEQVISSYSSRSRLIKDAFFIHKHKFSSDYNAEIFHKLIKSV